MRQKSKLILLIVAIGLATGLAAYVTHIKDHIMDKPFSSKRPIEIVDGATFEKSYDLSYDHLHVSIPDVSIDGTVEDQVHLSGFAVAQDIALLDVCNDTLYVKYSDEYTPKMVGKNALLALKVHVGGVGLKSITIDGTGNITIPVRPIGTSREGKTIYKEEDREKYTLVFDSLDIINGPVNMLLDGGHLSIKKQRDLYANIVLLGEVRSMSIDYNKAGAIRLMANELDCAVARVNGLKNQKGMIGGEMRMSVTDSLYAHLYGVMDVYYRGDPYVEKYEKSIGRVVHETIYEE